MSVALYSAIYGSYEATAKKLPEDLEISAFMFTDNEELAKQAEDVGWSAVVTSPPEFEVNPANGNPAVVRPMLEHKYWKTHPAHALAVAHAARRALGAPAEVSIWMDGSMEINCSGPEFVERNLQALAEDEWSLMTHPWRTCLFEEAVYSSTLIYRYDSDALIRQHDHYASLGHPVKWGLFATGHMVRRHTELVQRVSHHWWEENVAWSHQDQVSLPFLMRVFRDKEGLRWNTSLPWAGSWELHEHGC